jgi:hypothetical protein
LQNDKVAIVVDGSGRELRRFETGSVGRSGAETGRQISRAVRGDDLFIATCWPSAAARFSIATGKRLWQMTKTHPCTPGGCIATKTFVATWAPPPFIREKDSTIALFDPETGERFGTIDAKAPVLAAIALGEDAIAAFVEGRTPGNKVHVWRNIRSGPRADVLSGHKGRVRGVLPLGERLISWAADKTVRIWS